MRRPGTLHVFGLELGLELDFMLGLLGLRLRLGFVRVRVRVSVRVRVRFNVRVRVRVRGTLHVFAALS